MRLFQSSVAAVILASVLPWMVANAQRGADTAQEVAHQTERTEIVSLHGKVVEVKMSPCEDACAGVSLAASLVMETSDGTKVGVHLGPAVAVQFVTKDLTHGIDIKVDAFRSKEANVVLTGKCGANASRALSEAGIRVVPGCSGTVRTAVREFKAGELHTRGSGRSKGSGAEKTTRDKRDQ